MKFGVKVVPLAVALDYVQSETGGTALLLLLKWGDQDILTVGKLVTAH